MILTELDWAPVPLRQLPARIAKRAERAGVAIAPDVARGLAAYLELVGRWNRKINLTALHVDPPDDAAIDRLVIEAIAAARYLRPEDTRVLDIGSGGGSPAIPLKLAVPRLELTLVESKVRKAAFLREAVRQLDLEGVQVENRRLAEIAPASARADVATIRGVRLDGELVDVLGRLVRPGGRVFVFGGSGAGALASAATEIVPLLGERENLLLIACF